MRPSGLFKALDTRSTHKNTYQVFRLDQLPTGTPLRLLADAFFRNQMRPKGLATRLFAILGVL